MRACLGHYTCSIMTQFLIPQREALIRKQKEHDATLKKELDAQNVLTEEKRAHRKTKEELHTVNE